MSEELAKLLAEEFCEWKYHKQHIIRAFKDFKCTVKQREELSKSLENEIANLKETKCNITQELMFEMHHKFTISNSIFKLSELSDQVNSLCNDNEGCLEVCSTFEEKNKSILENMIAKSLQKIMIKKNILKSQSHDMDNIKNTIVNLSSTLMQERDLFGLNTLKEIKKKCMDDFNLIIHEREVTDKNILKSRENINNIKNNKEELTNLLLQKDQELKLISYAIENENVKSGECLNDFNSKITSMLKRFEEIDLNIDKSKTNLKECICVNVDFSKENTKLKLESKYCHQNCSAIAKLLTKEKDKYLCDSTALQHNVELLADSLQNRESILIREEEVKQTAINNMELLRIDVHKQRSQCNVMQESLNKLEEEIAHLVKVNDQRSDSIDLLSQRKIEKNIYIASVKNNINELKAKMLNVTSMCTNTTEKLSKEITAIKMKVNNKNTAIEVERSNLEKYIEKLKLEDKAKFSERKLEQEKEIEKIKQSKEVISDDMKQLIIKLERSALEVDILLRKIKTAKELIISLRTECQSKPQKVYDLKFNKKRQMDETTDSSFDGSLPFHERILMKKKKKNKLQFN